MRDFRLQKALRLPTFEAGGRALSEAAHAFRARRRIGHVFYPVHPPETHAARFSAWLATTRRRRLEHVALDVFDGVAHLLEALLEIIGEQRNAQR